MHSASEEIKQPTAPPYPAPRCLPPARQYLSPLVPPSLSVRPHVSARVKPGLQTISLPPDTLGGEGADCLACNHCVWGSHHGVLGAPEGSDLASYRTFTSGDC